PRHALVRLHLRRPGGRRPRAAPRHPPALRLLRALPGRDAGGARGRARRAGQDGALDLRPIAQGRPSLVPVAATVAKLWRERHGSRTYGSRRPIGGGSVRPRPVAATVTEHALTRHCERGGEGRLVKEDAGRAAGEDGERDRADARERGRGVLSDPYPDAVLGDHYG